MPLKSSNLSSEWGRLRLPPELMASTFTYFSVQETTGKDWPLPPNTHGLMTIGKQHGISEAIQNFKRDRRALEPDKSVTYVMFPEVAAAIPSQGEVPSSGELISWMIECEEKEMAQLVQLRCSSDAMRRSRSSVCCFCRANAACASVICA